MLEEQIKYMEKQYKKGKKKIQKDIIDLLKILQRLVALADEK